MTIKFNLPKEYSTLLSLVLKTAPIVALENVLIRAGDNCIELVTSNLSEWGRLTIPHNSEYRGEFLLNAQVLKPFAGKEVTMTIDGEKVQIGAAKYPIDNSEDFPMLPFEDYVEPTHAISAKTLVYLNTLTDKKDDLRPWIGCIHIGQNLVASNAHILAKLPGIDIEPICVNSKIWPKLKNPKVGRFIHNITNYLSIKDGVLEVAIRTDKVNYPDFDSVIPVKQPNYIEVNSKEFIQAIKDVSVAADKTTKRVVMTFGTDTVTLEAIDIDFATEAKVTIPATVKSDIQSLGFNHDFMLTVLGDCPETLKLEFSTENRAMTYDHNGVHLIMPTTV